MVITRGNFDGKLATRLLSEALPLPSAGEVRSCDGVTLDAREFGLLKSVIDYVFLLEETLQKERLNQAAAKDWANTD